MLCSADATKEVFAVRLRPGNAGTTTVSDHLEVLDAAVAGCRRRWLPGTAPTMTSRWCARR